MTKLATTSPTNLRSLAVRTLSNLRERRLRLPSPGFMLSPTAKKARTPHQKQVLAELRSEGFVRLPGMFDQETVARLQQGVDRMVEFADAAHNDVSRGEEFDAEHGAVAHEEELRYYAALDGMRFSEEVAEIALHDDLVSIGNSYFGKPAMLARAMLFRHLPLPRPYIYGFRWHHDGWGKKYNVMVLLTEVGEDDVYMRYLIGSHRRYHGYEGFRKEFLDEDAVAADPELSRFAVGKTTGKPGDAFVFDPNGFHQANRQQGRTRDVCILMYYQDLTFVHGHQIPERMLRERSQRDLLPLAGIIRSNRIRAQRGTTNVMPLFGGSWLTSLRHVRQWLL